MSTDDPFKQLIELSEKSLQEKGKLTLDEAFALDEEIVKRAMRDNPDLPESFVRDALSAKEEPVTTYIFDRDENSDKNQ